MRKGASAEARAKPVKSRCRVSSRSTLPCFLLCWGVSSVEANSQTCKQVSGDIHRVNNAATEVKPGWRSDCGSLAPPDVAALNAGCDAAKSRRQHRPALFAARTHGTHESMRPLVTAWFHAGISKYVEPALRGNAARLVKSTNIGGQHNFFTETKPKRIINDRHGQYDVDLGRRH